MTRMPKPTPVHVPAEAGPRVRRGYFEFRHGQLHVHNAIPAGGGFEEGTPLLCLHGAGGTGRMFRALSALAGRDRSVYAPDLPGSGESDPVPGTATVADYVQAIGDFLDNMRLRHIDVLGYAAGAVLATELALARPAQLRRLVLVSVPLGAEAPRGAGGHGLGLAAATAQYPLRERLARITQGVLLVRPRDEWWDAAARVRAVLPSARLAELPEEGPDLFEAAPGRVAEALREFLRG
jgi:pimeloyl-ACP methyl ester carboxylesterase